MVDEELVKATIAKIRPYLQYDGGDLELVKIEDDYVYVRVFGACASCMALDQTISGGVEALLLDEVPGIKGVRLADDFIPNDPNLHKTI